MMKLIKEIVGFIIFVAVVIAGLLIFRMYSRPTDHTPTSKPAVALDSKSETLKKYLVSGEKPERIEVTNLSKRYEKEIENFKSLKIPQDKKSTFYISIQFFTDESDNTAPLIAQIRFVDIKSGNTIKEESINLE